MTNNAKIFLAWCDQSMSSVRTIGKKINITTINNNDIDNNNAMITIKMIIIINSGNW